MKIEEFLNRTSVKHFDKKPMSQKDIETITKVINNSPTSTNAQQFSAIIFTKQEDKDWFSKNNWNQKHIADSAAFILFLADRTRAKYGAKHFTNESVAMHEFYRGIVDSTIAATYAHDALITLGYGVTFVGGVIAFAQEIEKRYDLSKDAQVVVALSIGKPTKINEFKPKMNKVFLDKYDSKATIEELKEYDSFMKVYYDKRGIHNDFISYQAKMIGPEANEYMEAAFTKSGKYIQKHIDISKEK